MPDKTFGDVLKLLGDLNTAVNNPDGKVGEAVANLKFLSQALTAAATAPNPRAKLAEFIAFEDGTELSDFFGNVASSLIAAQTELNKQSLAYSAQAAKQNLPPAQFAIPNLHAELRFGFSNVSGKGLNVVFFSSKEQREQHTESSVSFDIVAAPPDPKTVRMAAPKLIAITGDDRDAVLNKVLAVATANLSGDDTTLKPLKDPTALKLAAVFGFTLENGKERQLVIWPGGPVNTDTGHWRTFALGVLEDDQLINDIFSKKAPINKAGGLVLIPTDKDLNSADPGQLKDLIVNLGDALLNLCLLLN